MKNMKTNNKKKDIIELNYVINQSPVKLLNKNGSNICWWNSFAQLFATTRSLTIINIMNAFINEHDCSNCNDNLYIY